MGDKRQAAVGKIENEKDEPVIHKCLTRADRGDECCEGEDGETEGKMERWKREDKIRRDG